MELTAARRKLYLEAGKSFYQQIADHATTFSAEAKMASEALLSDASPRNWARLNPNQKNWQPPQLLFVPKPEGAFFSITSALHTDEADCSNSIDWSSSRLLRGEVLAAAATLHSSLFDGGASELAVAAKNLFKLDCAMSDASNLFQCTANDSARARALFVRLGVRVSAWEGATGFDGYCAC